MKSLVFFLFIVFMLVAGGLWLRVRARRLAEENAARSEARAQLLGLEAARDPAPRDAATAVADPATAAAATTTPAALRAAAATPSAGSAAPVASLATTAPGTDAERAPQAGSQAPAPAASDHGPPSARRLRRIKRSRFARVGIAYFEIMGFRAQRFGTRGDADVPIDMLLFMGASKVPAMALRWSRSEGERASRDELRAFAEACAKLRIARSTFIAQHGIDDEAAEYAISRGVASLDADTLALKLAEVDARHHPHLQALVHGAQ